MNKHSSRYYGMLPPLAPPLAGDAMPGVLLGGMSGFQPC